MQNIEIKIEEEITQSYIDYAMSVIISRALPDVRDGLKPVQRRILFAMEEMNLYPENKYKKSAAVVGEVLGKYHPHGDSSVYDALVRLAQIFSLRYPLIDGQGNFGSIDGDGAAAQRYTECKLSKISTYILKDLYEDTIERRENYDQSRKEPTVLPTIFPNILCNGTMGIAVGMATNMPPHNLNEIVDALVLLIDNPNVSIDEIMEIIKGPDFPTGGILIDFENIKKVYKSGKGSITIRGKIEKMKDKIIIKEIPYQVNKASLVNKISQLVADKKIEGISEIIDESSKNEIKITLYLKKNANIEGIIENLYKYTDLETKFNVNNIALIDGIQPKLLNIKELLEEFIKFRKEIIIRRSKFRLKKNQDRLHILEGLKKATDILDEVIKNIKESKTREEAKEKLIKLGFTEEQAEHILLMRLQSLVNLEILKILQEIDERKNQINYLNKILNDENELKKVIKDELIELKNNLGDKRRTSLARLM